MLVGTLAMWPRVGLLLLAGIGTGVANGIAGGGTFISFPTLLAVGIAPLQANVSTSVGVWPSYVGGIRAFRPQLVGRRPLILDLLAWCIAGSLVGTVLLLSFPATVFARVVPWLIAVGTLIFALSPLITRRLAHLDHDHPARRRVLHWGLLGVAIYGGYFGAGLGILLLAVMAVALPYSLNELQGLRNVISTIINAVAGVIFIVRGHLALQAVGLLLIGTFLGGYAGSWLIQRLPPWVVRTIIVCIGGFTALKLLLH
ncbi:MAG: sulfite exporter TauE/SafE family protein [Acidimicrobiaceae bacterium]|jgi:uncharacterized membrane protein YfcA|nr:sulfite exporter TauE/SafE family protein [Acidimicrobiaceae bacterium]